MVDSFTARYTNPKTRADKARDVGKLLGDLAPWELRDSDVLDWARGAGKALANNSVRNRLGLARTFLRWCDRRAVGPGLDLEEEFAVLRRSYPATYGKVQDKHPARRLTMDEAQELLAACSDGTWQGSRDQVAIRLGLLGVRVAEICRMTWGNLLPDDSLSWIGKGRQHRTARIGPTFADRLSRWHTAYEKGLGRPVTADDPIICRMNTANQHTTGRRPAWGSGITPDAFRRMLQSRADAAGLGHVSPHDLRRSTAKILHDARSADGGHLFNVEDIRVVLGHRQLATTQRYIDAMDTEALDKAAPVLDLE